MLAFATSRADLVITGGGLSLVDEGGVIAPGNLAAGKTAFAKDVLPGYAVHAIAHANDQNFGNSFSWIGDSLNSFVGIDFGATPVHFSGIAFPSAAGRTYSLQTSADLSPGSWTSLGLPGPLAGDGVIKQFTVPALDARRFFRVTVAP